MFHHKVHSLSSKNTIFFGVRFVETVCYVFHKMHSLSSKSVFILSVRFVETVCYVFHKMHSLSSKTGIISPYAVGFEVCVSSRRFARFS